MAVQGQDRRAHYTFRLQAYPQPTIMSVVSKPLNSELSTSTSIPGSLSDIELTETGLHPRLVTPPELERAVRRLQFPPSYVVVGIYRLITDKTLSKPAWDKCKHGTQRGLMVGVVWVRACIWVSGNL